MVVAEDLDRIIDLQDAGRVVVDAVSADVDVVIEQLVAGAEDYVRTGIVDQADVRRLLTGTATGQYAER
ncbi:hypothetical protein D3C87_1670120 [compost metagenome]